MSSNYSWNIERQNTIISVSGADFDSFVLNLADAVNELTRVLAGFIGANAAANDAAGVEDYGTGPALVGDTMALAETFAAQQQAVPDSPPPAQEPPPKAVAPEPEPAPRTRKPKAVAPKIVEPEPIEDPVPTSNGNGKTLEYSDMLELMDRFVEKHPDGNLGARALVKKHGAERLRMLPPEAYPALAAEVRNYLGGK